MEARLTATYAESQVHLLINDLKNSSHNIRIKAVKRFQDYISLKPEVIVQKSLKRKIYLLN